MNEQRPPSRLAHRVVALAVGVPLSISLWASPAMATSAAATPLSRTENQWEVQHPDPNQAFQRSVIGAGAGFLGSVGVLTALQSAGGGRISFVDAFTTGSISTLAGALGSSAGHFYAGDPARGLGMGALGTLALTGASLGGMLVTQGLGLGSWDGLAAGSFLACAGTLMGWTYFMAGDARHLADDDSTPARPSP